MDCPNQNALGILRLVGRFAYASPRAIQATFGSRRPQPLAVLGSFRDLIASLEGYSLYLGGSSYVSISHFALDGLLSIPSPSFSP